MKKKRYMKKKKKQQPFRLYTTPKFTPMFCGSPLNKNNWNQLWRWDTLAEIVNSQYDM